MEANIYLNNLALDQKIATKTKEKVIAEVFNTYSEIAKGKIYNEKDAFLNRLEEYKDKLGNQYQSFVDYWTEADAKGKMRYQDQKFFDISRRIGTWIKNAKNFEPTIQTTKIKLK